MKEKEIYSSALGIAQQEDWCYNGNLCLQSSTDIHSEQMRFHAVQQKGQGDDGRKGIEW